MLAMEPESDDSSEPQLTQGWPCSKYVLSSLYVFIYSSGQSYEVNTIIISVSNVKGRQVICPRDLSQIMHSTTHHGSRKTVAREKDAKRNIRHNKGGVRNTFPFAFISSLQTPPWGSGPPVSTFGPQLFLLNPCCPPHESRLQPFPEKNSSLWLAMLSVKFQSFFSEKVESLLYGKHNLTFSG